MSVAIVTGASGLIGSEAAIHFAELGLDVVGIDNDMRATFFGAGASTLRRRAEVEQKLGSRYSHRAVDIRDAGEISRLFSALGGSVELVVHAAAQPSHDWAARDPYTDFGVNAVGTLNLLEATRCHASDAVFIFTSTNKVYGDAPNRLPLIETHTRWELPGDHEYHRGVPETFPIDQSLHSLFGASKLAADVLVQEYGRYFGMRTACFRGGCLTGPGHAGAELHGFLAYLVQCAATGTPYRIFGYKGKQVRDNIHSADLVAAFEAFFRAPRVGEVYNIGGGRHSNCSMLEAIEIAGEVAGRELDWTYVEDNRIGDHMWWISDLSRFSTHYPGWRMRYDVPGIIREIFAVNESNWRATAAG